MKEILGRGFGVCAYGGGKAALLTPADGYCGSEMNINRIDIRTARPRNISEPFKWALFSAFVSGLPCRLLACLITHTA